MLVDKSCNAAVLEDFAELRRAGVVHRLMDEIERVGGGGTDAAPTPAISRLSARARSRCHVSRENDGKLRLV